MHRSCVHRQMAGELKSITPSRTPTGKYFAARPCEDVPELPTIAPANAIVGRDARPSRISPSRATAGGPTTSNSSRAQRNLWRKQKGSNNRAKARRLVGSARKCCQRPGRLPAHAGSTVRRRQPSDRRRDIEDQKTWRRTATLHRRLQCRLVCIQTKAEYKAERAGKHFVGRTTGQPRPRRARAVASRSPNCRCRFASGRVPTAVPSMVGISMRLAPSNTSISSNDGRAA
jgi:putative transposase